MVAADQHGLRAAGAHAGGIEHPTQRGAEVHLEHPRVRDGPHPGAGDRGQERARLGRRARAPVPVGTVTGGERQLGQRLGVEHQCRSAAHPALVRRRQRVGGHARAAVDQAGQGRGLPGHELPVQREHLESARPGSRRCGVDVRADGQHGTARTDRPGHQPEAVDHQGGVAGEQRGVLPADRLALHRVAHHHGPASVRGPQLGGGGEARTATTVQPDLVGQRGQAVHVVRRERGGARLGDQQPVPADRATRAGFAPLGDGHRAPPSGWYAGRRGRRTCPLSAYDGSSRQVTASSTAATQHPAVASSHPL